MPLRKVDIKCQNCGSVIEDVGLIIYDKQMETGNPFRCSFCFDGDMIRVYTPHPEHSSWKG